MSIRTLSNTQAGYERQVAIVDDDPALRDAIVMLLKSDGVQACAYDSAESFLGTATPDSVSCIILDIKMPGLSGLELQQVLEERRWSAPIIFITGHVDVEIAVIAMRRGAFHFLQKPFEDSELIDAVADALSHLAHQEREHEHLNELVAKYATLSPREKEVMALVTQGHANKVIAFDLSVSQRTVEIHRARVMKKMGVRSLAELVRAEIELGTVPKESKV